jgi:anti-sigma factor RsiW
MMMRFWEDWFKSAEEKKQEAVSAYLDGQLAPAEKQRFEQELAVDAKLQAEVEQLHRLKRNLSRLPRQRAPRNFTLDPARYGRPVSITSGRLYPAMRTATVLTAFFFILAIAFDLLTAGTGVAPTMAPVAFQRAAEPTMDMALESAPAPGALAFEEAPATDQESLTMEALDAAGEASPPLATAVAVPTMAALATGRASEATAEAEGTQSLQAPQFAATPTVEAFEAPAIAADPLETETKVQMEEAPATAPLAGITPLRLLQISLAIAVTLLGVTTYLLRRRQ